MGIGPPAATKRYTGHQLYLLSVPKLLTDGSTWGMTHEKKLSSPISARIGASLDLGTSNNSFFRTCLTCPAAVAMNKGAFLRGDSEGKRKAGRIRLTL